LFSFPLSPAEGFVLNVILRSPLVADDEESRSRLGIIRTNPTTPRPFAEFTLVPLSHHEVSVA